jgi:peptide/nickel transport system ATP-binding protein
MHDPVLTVRNLEVSYETDGAAVTVLRGVDLDLTQGEALGLVGESGCGKSTTLLAVLGLLPSVARVRGSIRFEGRELLGAGEHELRRVRGSGVTAIFQNARGALHPMRRVGDQVARVIRRHRGVAGRHARAEAVDALSAAGLPDAEQLAERYPHQLSGGQCQRALIAAALAARPRLILADEPTSGLDVTVQEQVLETLAERVSESGAALLLVSHDLRVIERVCARVAIMYAGEVVEAGSREEVLGSPKHPYTQGLIGSLGVRDGRMGFIPGTVPDLRLPIRGCAFVNRCALRRDGCMTSRPAMRQIVGCERVVRCVLYPESPIAYRDEVRTTC